MPHTGFSKLKLMTQVDQIAIDEAVREAIQNIAVGPDRGRDISRKMAHTVMSAILQGRVDEVQAAIFLIALRMKRESLEEFSGLLDALIESSISMRSDIDDIVVLVDPFDGYSRTSTITPFVPAVLASLGLHTVVHGVETVGPKNGVTAHKVYKLAGAQTNYDPKSANAVLEGVGMCYVDQSQYANSLFKLNNLRSKIIKRTAVTTLERVLVPVRGKKTTALALGYVHKAYPQIYTQMAFQSGFDQLVLMKGVEGGLAPALNKPLRRFEFESGCEFAEGDKQVLNTCFSDVTKQAALPLDPNLDPVKQTLDVGLKALSGADSLATKSLVLASANIVSGLNHSLSLDDAVEKVHC